MCQCSFFHVYSVHKISECSGKMDLVVMADGSGSISKEDWNRVLDFLAAIANSFTIIGDKGLKVGRATHK